MFAHPNVVCVYACVHVCMWCNFSHLDFPFCRVELELTSPTVPALRGTQTHTLRLLCCMKSHAHICECECVDELLYPPTGL